MSAYQKQFDEIRQQIAYSASAQQRIELATGRMEDQLKNIMADLEGKVSKELYDGQHERLADRVTRLESGPQRFMQWLALIISALSIGLVMLGMLGGALVYILSHH